MLAYASCASAADFDRGYANSIDGAVVAKWEAYFRARSDEAQQLPHHKLHYGPDVRNRIDFFPAAVPEGTKAPLLIAIHGGLWFLFDKWLMHFLAPAFTAAGIHVACPNYRLAPLASLDDIVKDCRRAVAHLYQQRDELHIDPLHVAVTGHSAAGQLAAVMASTDWHDHDDQLPAQILRAWIGVSGFYDIEPFPLTSFQAQVGFEGESYYRWNPVSLVHAGMPPSLLITGGRESALLHEMAEGYAALLRNYKVPVQTIDAPDECHFSVLAQLGDPTTSLHREVLALLKPASN